MNATVTYPAAIETELGLAINMARMYYIEKKKLAELKRLDEAVRIYKQQRKTNKQ